MAFAARARNNTSEALGHAAKALGSPVKIQEGSLSLPAVYVRALGEYKFSSRITVQLRAFRELEHQPVPEVVCTDGQPARLYTLASDGSYMDVNVARTKEKDPSGKLLANGRDATVSVFHRLAVPFRIRAQDQFAVMVGSKNLELRPLEPIMLVNVFVEPYEQNDKKTKQATGETRFSLHAGGYNRLPALADPMQDFPLTDVARRIMPYEEQLLPTRAQLANNAPGFQPAPFARLATPLHAGSAPADSQVGAGKYLPSVRLEVNMFVDTLHGGAWNDYYVLPSEEYALTGETNQGMTAVATKIPVWSVRGANTAANASEPAKYRKPKMGGTMLFAVQVARDLDLGTAAPHPASIAVEIPFFPEHMVNAPTWFMPLLDRITAGNAQRPPVPFVIQPSVNVSTTLLDPRPFGTFTDGVLLANLHQGPLWRIRDYVERYGIPVSEDVVLNGRFSKGTGRARFVPDKDKVELWYEDAFEGKAERQQEVLVRYDQLSNPDGCVLLDMLQDDIPDADRWPDGTRFYALSLSDAAGKPMPRAQDAAGSLPAQWADKAGLPQSMRPWRCGLASEAEGDAYVLAELVALGRIPANSKGTLAETLAAKPGLIFPDTPNAKTPEGDYAASLPYFCFFAVTPVPEAAHTSVKQPSRLLPRGTKRAAAAPPAEPAAKKVRSEHVVAALAADAPVDDDAQEEEQEQDGEEKSSQEYIPQQQGDADDADFSD